MHNDNRFDYTYSAQKRTEIENIRKKYLPKEEDKMEQLRALHHSAYGSAKAWSIAVGVLGSLILGTGMSLTMTELGASLGHFAFVLGVIIGFIGIVLVILAYPVYIHVLKAARAKIAPEILRLSDELLK